MTEYSLVTGAIWKLLESDVTVKEAQTLARHSTPDLTINTYGRTREDRLAEFAPWGRVKDLVNRDLVTLS